MSQLLTDIDAFLARQNMSPTAFGMKAMGDPKFVPDLRAGRRLWPETEQRVREYMRSHSTAKGRETTQ